MIDDYRHNAFLDVVPTAEVFANIVGVRQPRLRDDGEDVKSK